MADFYSAPDTDISNLKASTGETLELFLKKQMASSFSPVEFPLKRSTDVLFVGSAGD